jgi:predicted 3-demethylubiquinone-9 3-methyltransferase (glyoxalase superfamily)
MAPPDSRARAMIKNAEASTPVPHARAPGPSLADFFPYALSVTAGFVRPRDGKRSYAMQKIVPFLWFDDQAEESMTFYVSIFKNSKVGSVTRYGDAGPGPKGQVMSASFQLEGQDFYALNGGPQFSFTPAISLFVNCTTQAEVDELWERLSKGGQTQPCGWLTDKYGVSWQIIPTVLGEMLADRSPQKSQAVMQAMLQMSKIDIAALRRAYAEG